MSILVLCAVALTRGVFSVTPLDGGLRLVLSSTQSREASKDVRCRWTVYKDALPAATGWWPVGGLGAGTPVTNAAPPALLALYERGGDFALRVRFVTGDEDPDKETLLAVSQIDYPRTKTRPLSPFVGKPAELIPSAEAYEFKLPSARIRFDRGTGLLAGYATGWWSLTEWLKRPMAFDFGDPAPRVRVERFSEPVETNGVWRFKTVSWWTMGKGSAVTNFELRVTTDWQVRGDGRIVSETVVRPFGLRYILPRVGWAFVLAPPDPLVQYYGRGPAAGDSDRRYEGLTGLYSASVAGCGNHASTRAVSFDAGSDHFAFSTLGDDFTLELGPTPSKATFCGLVFARQAETDRDWRFSILISPEKTLQALAPPAQATGEGERREARDASGEGGRREAGDASGEGERREAGDASGEGGRREARDASGD